MKILIYTALTIGAISLIVGIISRVTLTPITLVRGGLEAEAFLAFTNTCLLAAIALALLEMLKGK